MRFLKLILSLLTLLAASSFAQEKFDIDVSHSNVNFTVRHMVVAKVSGSFREFSGTIIYDENDVAKSSVNVTIKAKSINTQNGRRDDHLRTSDFFNADTDSLITFASKKIEKRDDSYVAIGDFTLRGVTKEIALPFTIFGKIKDQRGDTRLGIEAKTTINRFDYGVKWASALEGGNLVVSKDVDIILNIEGKAPKMLDEQKK